MTVLVTQLENFFHIEGKKFFFKSIANKEREREREREREILKIKKEVDLGKNERDLHF